MKTNKTISSLMVMAGLTCSQAFGTIVYNNTATDTFDSLSYVVNGFTQIGDQITLGGTDRNATSARVEFYNNGTSGTFDATLRFYQIGSPVGVQIGTNYTQTGITSLGASVVDVTFTLPNLLVPNSFIFTLSIANLSSGVDIIGPEMYEPPSVGSSDNTFAIGYNGSAFVKQSTANENAYFQLQATTLPEPGTAGLAGVCLIGLAMFGRRLRRA